MFVVVLVHWLEKSSAFGWLDNAFGSQSPLTVAKSSSPSVWSDAVSNVLPTSEANSSITNSKPPTSETIAWSKASEALTAAFGKKSGKLVEGVGTCVMSTRLWWLEDGENSSHHGLPFSCLTECVVSVNCTLAWHITTRLFLTMLPAVLTPQSLFCIMG